MRFEGANHQFESAEGLRVSSREAPEPLGHSIAGDEGGRVTGTGTPGFMGGMYGTGPGSVVWYCGRCG